MGEMIHFNEQRQSQDPLVVVIRNAFEANGSLSQDLETLSVPVELWRKAARAAGRDLGRPVETLVMAGAVHAVLRDWPQGEREKEIHRQVMSDAVSAVSLAEEVLTPITSCASCGSANRRWKPGASIEQPGVVVCDNCGLTEVSGV